jgi:hypothetical protein
MKVHPKGAAGREHPEFHNLALFWCGLVLVRIYKFCFKKVPKSCHLALDYVERFDKAMRSTSALIGITLLFVFPIFAWANMITVVNPSFEILPDGGLSQLSGIDGSYSIDTAIPGWTSTDTSNSGQFQPGTPDVYFNHYFDTLDDGITSAWSRSATLSQPVGPTVQAGITYILTVDLGYRNDLSFDGTAGLLINGNWYQATGTTPAQGYWSTYTATYTGTEADAGAPITIELSANGQQGNFDNVKLSDSDPVAPEPAFGGLVAACLIGLVGCRRRQRAR